jgi:hypothetical protein
LLKERSVCAADALKDNEIGRCRPSRTTRLLTTAWIATTWIATTWIAATWIAATWIAAAWIAAAWIAAVHALRLINRHPGICWRRFFRIACNQAIGRRVVPAQSNGGTYRQYQNCTYYRSKNFARIHHFPSL